MRLFSVTFVVCMVFVQVRFGAAVVLAVLRCAWGPPSWNIGSLHLGLCFCQVVDLLGLCDCHVGILLEFSVMVTFGGHLSVSILVI